MSLTAGSGPFGEHPAGRFNFRPDPPDGTTLFWEPFPLRVRVFVGDEAVADSRGVHLLHETGHLPVYYFPPADVRADYLESSEKRTRCPHKGEAVHHSLRVGARLVPDAVWEYAEPLEPAAFIAGYLAFYWDRVDRILVEETEAHGHPRDPYHRIDVYPAPYRVRVSLDGEQLAESTRPMLLSETALPLRWYLPRADVRTDLLEASETKTRCAYKGLASHWNALGHGDVAWSYPEPDHDGEPVRGMYAFYDDRVQIDVEPLAAGEMREPEHHRLRERIVAEEHHLQQIAKVGYEPATLPILMVAIIGVLAAVVGIALGIALAVYYTS